MKRKGITPLFGAVIVAAIGIAMLITGVPGMVYGIITGPQYCGDSPFNANCFCYDGEDRLSVLAFGTPKYICESSDKFIDPDSAGWEADAIAYAESVLGASYPECNMKSCSDGTWSVRFGWFEYQKRDISVECMVSDQRFANVVFGLADGDIKEATCSDYFDKPGGDGTLTYNYIGNAICTSTSCIAVKYQWHANCGESSGIVSGNLKYVLPDGKSANSWDINAGGPVECSVTEFGSTSVSVTCNADCTGLYGGYGGDLLVFPRGTSLDVV